MLIYSNSVILENNFKLFNLNDLLIQPMDCEEGFEPKTKRRKPLETLVSEISLDLVNTKYRKHPVLHLIDYLAVINL